MKHIIIILSLLFIIACSSNQQAAVSMEQINTEEAAGDFGKAKKSIDLYIAQNNLSAEEIYDLNFRKDVMNRIVLDFWRDKDHVVEYIKKYYPDVNDEMLTKWEQEKVLESMVIDGQKKYFGRTACNLFLVNKDARAKKEEIDGPITERYDKTLITHIPEVTAELKKSGKTQAKQKKMKVSYKVILKENAVPEGEVIRCWLPYPREDNRRQTNIKLLAVNSNSYIITPSSAVYPHRTLYMEKTTEKDKPLEFSLEFTYSSAAEWYNLEGKDFKPYDKNSELYRTYTAERKSHVIFTDKIKDLSMQIVGDETNPYIVVRKIFDWITDHYPWAGVREYSTIPNIPEYVIDNNHGDCGQVSLLFITLARYNGIPAKWQSGFMMHPNGVNLHDWAEVYYEGVGWVPVDQSFGRKDYFEKDEERYLLSNGIDAYRWIVNDDYSRPLFPLKIYPRSETVDFQRGELEWRGGNIYFDQWSWGINVEYLD
ncbi:MAG: transglutaminase domain-containing protein [Prevotellaceae bacterium]|jgi:transglutaminase-like putative cysteine protease|nr:transglutaminase domain-containing protein [Prevotellaceae bacterium]